MMLDTLPVGELPLWPCLQSHWYFVYDGGDLPTRGSHFSEDFGYPISNRTPAGYEIVCCVSFKVSLYSILTTYLLH